MRPIGGRGEAEGKASLRVSWTSAPPAARRMPQPGIPDQPGCQDEASAGYHGGFQQGRERCDQGGAPDREPRENGQPDAPLPVPAHSSEDETDGNSRRSQHQSGFHLLAWRKRGSEEEEKGGQRAVHRTEEGGGSGSVRGHGKGGAFPERPMARSEGGASPEHP